MRRSRHWIRLMAGLAADIIDEPDPGPVLDPSGCPRRSRPGRWLPPLDRPASRAEMGIECGTGRAGERCRAHR